MTGERDPDPETSTALARTPDDASITPVVRALHLPLTDVGKEIARVVLAVMPPITTVLSGSAATGLVASSVAAAIVAGLNLRGIAKAARVHAEALEELRACVAKAEALGQRIDRIEDLLEQHAAVVDAVLQIAATEVEDEKLPYLRNVLVGLLTESIGDHERRQILEHVRRLTATQILALSEVPAENRGAMDDAERADLGRRLLAVGERAGVVSNNRARFVKVLLRELERAGLVHEGWTFKPDDPLLIWVVPTPEGRRFLAFVRGERPPDW